MFKITKYYFARGGTLRQTATLHKEYVFFNSLSYYFREVFIDDCLGMMILPVLTVSTLPYQIYGKTEVRTTEPLAVIDPR